jgi:preprotein translocase subunit SecF
MTNYNFSSKFKQQIFYSLPFFLSKYVYFNFKGLNYGIDFKGGTLIELRSNNTDASIN